MLYLESQYIPGNNEFFYYLSPKNWGRWMKRIITPFITPIATFFSFFLLIQGLDIRDNDGYGRGSS